MDRSTGPAMAVSSPRALLAASSARAVAGDSGSYIRFVVGFDSELSWPWCKAALATVLLLTCTVLWLSWPFRQSSTGDGAGRQSCTGDGFGRQSSTGDGAGRHSSTGDGAGRQNSRTAARTQTEPSATDATTEDPAAHFPRPRELWVSETGTRFHSGPTCHGIRGLRRVTPCLHCNRSG